MAIDWNQPLYVERTGVQVYLAGIEVGYRNGDHGEMILVQDRSGTRYPFYRCGTPIGHLHSLTNDGLHQFPVRTRLAQIIHLRALSLLGLDEAAMTEHEAWGAF
jgi:hypothetical protein